MSIGPTGGGAPYQNNNNNNNNNDNNDNINNNSRNVVNKSKKKDKKKSEKSRSVPNPILNAGTFQLLSAKKKDEGIFTKIKNKITGEKSSQNIEYRITRISDQSLDRNAFTVRREILQNNPGRIGGIINNPNLAVLNNNNNNNNNNNSTHSSRLESAGEPNLDPTNYDYSSDSSEGTGF